MIIREAQISDIPQLMIIRLAVKENVLSNPALVPAADYETYLTKRGKGWLYETNGNAVGFSVVDLMGNNVWALFVNPDNEGKGIGKQLHDEMLRWYFNQTKETIWLGTEPGTRAAMFYRNAGWADKGMRKNGEIRFEMTFDDWNKINAAK